MIYIYDIILNFQNDYYQFFEWSPKDKIINIPKIPLYRVSDKDILYLKKNNIIVDESIISKIKKANKSSKKITCIVSNKKIAIALLFNNQGKLLKKSSLIFEEEEEAISLAKNIKETNIIYKKNINCKCKNKLRIEKEKKDIIVSYINNTKDITALKYLYYECYEKELENELLLRKKILKELKKEWNEKQRKIFKIVNILISTN